MSFTRTRPPGSGTAVAIEPRLSDERERTLVRGRSSGSLELWAERETLPAHRAKAARRGRRVKRVMAGSWKLKAENGKAWADSFEL
jgi:hypothetical protein